MASSLHDADASFLAAILGPESPSGDPWSFVRRGGRVLLACRGSNASLEGALTLYQPQRPAAKLVRSALAFGAPLGAVKWLPSRRFSIASGCPLGSIERELGTTIISILLGNPKQPERRAILLEASPDNEPRVYKLGTHPLAVAAVRRESDFLGTWGGRLPAVPSREAEVSGEGWHAFAIAFLEGKAVEDPEVVTGLLEQWLLPGAAKPAIDFPAWQAIDADRILAGKAEAFRELGQRLTLRPSLVHHDLAPWNLIRTTDGRVIAIDWENGEAGGVPGWDLVHFLFQIGSLVKRLPPSALLDGIQGSLDTEPARRFLKVAGWGGATPWLVASYLAQRAAAGDDSVQEALALALARIPDPQTTA